MSRAVHQFVPGLARRDGVGDEVMAWRSLLRAAGYDSDIFAGVLSPADRRDGVVPFDDYRSDGRALLIYHHAIGNDFVGMVSLVPDRIVLRYHNLTPARFFAGNPIMQYCMRVGARQVRFLRDVVVGALCASTFNADGLRAAGYAAPVIVPSIFSLERLRHRGAQPPLPDAAEPLVLCVGRGAANKRQDHVVHAFERFALRFAPAARLALVGDLYADFEWGARLAERIHGSPARDRIDCPGAVSDAELTDYYRRARLYLSMSEHEGFCIPPLESFGWDVPVLAYRTPAVAETMRGAGVLFTRKHWDDIAALMADLCFDDDLRRRVAAGQRERLAQPDFGEARERLLASVEAWLPSTAQAPRPRRAATPLRLGLIAPLDAYSELASCTRALARALESAGAAATILADPSGPLVGVDPPNTERIWSGGPAGFVSAAIEGGLNTVHLAVQPARFTDPGLLRHIIDGLHAADIRVCLTVHGPLPVDPDPLRHLVAEAGLGRVDVLLAHRRVEAERLRAAGLGPTRVLPFGLPPATERDRAELAADLGVDGRRVVTFFSRPTPDCGLREAIEAAFLLQRQYPDLLLLVVAPQWYAGPWYLDVCRARVEQVELSAGVLFFDRPMSEALMAMLLEAAELALVPTIETGGEPPASLRLPLAARRATVAPHWLCPDGAEDAVYDLRTVSPQSIANALGDLLGDSDRRAACEAAAGRVAAEQSWDRVAAEFLTALGFS